MTTPRNALVTGGASGIGRATAERLARDGYRVWIADRDGEGAGRIAAAIAAAGGQATPLTVDVTARADLETAAARIYDSDGRLDVLAANAGVSTMNAFLDLTDEEWDFNFAVNTRGAFLTLQTFARRMVRQEPMAGRAVRGKIIATASMAGRRAAALLAHYSASKFAVVGLVHAVAKELAPHGITVNAVNPGYVKTSMQERELVWEARLRGLTIEQVAADYVRDTPLGRIETPEDVAGVVAFLAGPDADFITGEAVEVNGGAWIQ